MTIDLTQIANIASALIAIIAFAKLIVDPFVRAIKKNDETMKSLEKSLDELSFELKDSKKDRDGIHKVLDRHEERIGRSEDTIITHGERINTLFKKTNR